MRGLHRQTPSAPLREPSETREALSRSAYRRSDARTSLAGADSIEEDPGIGRCASARPAWSLGAAEPRGPSAVSNSPAVAPGNSGPMGSEGRRQDPPPSEA